MILFKKKMQTPKTFFWHIDRSVLKFHIVQADVQSQQVRGYKIEGGGGVVCICIFYKGINVLE